MKASEIKSGLKALIEIHQPVFLWGPPGIGKSQVVGQVARELGLEVKDVRVVLLDPVDLRGLPHINDDKRADWSIPAFLPQEGKGVLFLDELNAAPPLVQAACYQLVLDRRLGDYELPDGWSIVAAGNRENDRAVTYRMPSALANRFIHFDFDVNVEDWLLWAMTGKMPPELISFIRFRPGLLHDFDPSRNEKAFPTPRSWEFVARILRAVKPTYLEHHLIAGAVGEGAAAELAGYLKVWRELPESRILLEEPHRVEVPKDPATLFATCEMLAQEASERTIDAILTFANRLPSEFNVLLVRNSVKLDNSLVESAAFSHWAECNAEVLI
jgi:MoxR-like ATPase